MGKIRIPELKGGQLPPLSGGGILGVKEGVINAETGKLRFRGRIIPYIYTLPQRQTGAGWRESLRKGLGERVGSQW